MNKIILSLILSLLISPAFAKNYNVRDIYGRQIQFSIPSNQWIVINYWATWCGACVEEIPELNKLANALRQKNAVFFAVDFEGLPASQLRAFASRFGMSYPVMRYNPVNGIVDPDNFTSIPVTVVISPHGKMTILQGSQSVNDILGIMA